MAFFFKSQVGLDIQPDGVRLAAGYYSRGRYHLRKLAYRALPQGWVQSGPVIDWSRLSLDLQRWVDQLGVSGCRTAVSLPMSAVRLQTLQLPLGLHQSDIQAEIHAQLQRDLPGCQEKLATDFVVSPAASGYQQVVFAAAKEGILQPYMQGLQTAGLSVQVIDIDLYALKRAIAAQLDSFMMLQLTSPARLVVYKGNDIVFHEQQHPSELLQPWLMTCLGAAQHVSVDKYLVVGSAESVKQVLSELPDIHHKSWEQPAHQAFLPLGFELAYGLALRVM